MQVRTIWYVSARDDLLDAVVDHFAIHGIGDLSLRGLAGDLGTSHRMLIYHFGSKDGLLVEVVRRVEQRQRVILIDLVGAPDGDVVELSQRFWQHITRPEFAPFERLFFEVYANALQGRSWAKPLLPDVIDSWLGPLTALFSAAVGPDRAPHVARLALAISRGLLLDLLATNDQSNVDAALAEFVPLIAP
jgi:AcrR family transcriptional regulator